MGALIIAGYDTLDPASPVRVTDQNPSLGGGVPDTAKVARLLLDGDVIVGSRTGNRPIVLPLVIDGATLADRVRIFNDLARQVDQAQWQMPWTPDGLPTVVFDCFRGVAVREWSTYASTDEVLFATLSFEAGPFTRDAALVTITPVDVPDLSMPATIMKTADNGRALMSTDGTDVIQPWTDPDSGLGFFLLWFGGSFGTVQDFSRFERLTFSMASRSILFSQSGPASGVGVFADAFTPAHRDVVSPPSPGYVVFTMVDDAGKRASRVSKPPYQEGPAQGDVWAKTRDVEVLLNEEAVVAEAGFDRARVSSWWVRWYLGYSNTTWLENTAPTSVFWVTASANVGLAGALAQSLFRGVEGTARAPVGVNVDAGVSKAKRVLLVRSVGRERMLLTAPSVDNSPAADTTALSGKSRTLSGAVRYQAPAADYGGSYAVLARARRTAAGSGPWTVQVQVDAGPVVSRTLTAADLPQNVWQIVTLGQVQVPAVAVGRDSTVQATVRISAAASGADVSLDMLVLVPADADFLLVDAPTAYRYWWLTVPNSVDRSGVMFAGQVADGSDAVSVSAYQTGQSVFHFEPGDNQLCLLLDQAGSDAWVTVSYYPRWFGERPE